MVFNRLCDPCSKLSLLEWAQGVHVLAWMRESSNTIICCGLSVERSLERLRAVKAGTLRAQAQQVPYLTALNETHKEHYEQLELLFPKVKDLSQGAL